MQKRTSTLMPSLQEPMYPRSFLSHRDLQKRVHCAGLFRVNPPLTFAFLQIII
jgi:hypothetical protein